MLAKLARNIARRLTGRTAAQPAAAALADAAFARCLALGDADRLEDACACYEALLRAHPRHARARNNLGLVYQRRGQTDEAIAAFTAAISVGPAVPESYVNLGNAVQAQGDIHRALELYETALRIRPDFAAARYCRATALLSLGRYDEGWREYEWRWLVEGAEPAPWGRFAQPQWDGSQALESKAILLHGEQGFGDVIQFARYAALVAARGARVVIGCAPELARVLRTVEGVHAVLDVGEPLPAFDYHAPLMSLRLALRTTAATVPAHVPYLRPDAQEAAAWRAKVESVGSGPRIGIAWAGNPRTFGVRDRSLPAEVVAKLVGVPGCTFFSLQKGAPERYMTDLRDAGGVIHDYSAAFHDFSDTAACISALDLVVSIDTAVAHLAGALAKPVWVILPFVADWRWGASASATPWYPTMRLFRQDRPRDWSRVSTEVTAELSRLQSGLRERMRC